MPQPPNMLVIMADQQKATAIRMYSRIGIPTPNLERLAARGTRFDQCYTPHPLCVPARVSFWTGRYTHEHGARTNEIPMPPTERHFADLLREQGYRLALFGKNHCFPAPEEERLFDDRYVFSHQGPEPEQCESAREAEVVRWIRSPQRTPGKLVGPARVNPYAAADCPTAILERCVTRFLDRQGADDRPFCAWVSIPDPHGPLQCPEPYASMHPPASIELPPWRDGDLDGKMERARVFAEMFDYAGLSEDEIRFRVSIYYGMIRFLDDAVGRMLDALERRGLAEDTIVVFTSDHGDYSGEHRLTDKSSTFLDCMTRVPLIVSWPGHLPEGQVDRNPVSLLDVMPTCLGLAGIERPAGIDGRMLPGTGDDPPRDAVFSEYGAGGPRLTLADARRLMDYPWQEERPAIPLLRWREAEGHPKMVRMGRYKYVFDPMDEVDELYDLEADPWELSNVAADPAHADVRRALRDRLLEWSIRTEGGRPAPLYFDPVTGRNTPTAFVPARTAL
jgi:arylsulfatase A-like enzyme